MKIAILAHLKFPIVQPFAGGLEMQTHMLADSLIRRGHDVTLFAAEGSVVRLGLRAVGHPTGQGNGDPVLQRSIDAAEAASYATMMDLVADGDFDLVHNNSLHATPLLESRLAGVPMVTALHTPPFDPLSAAAGEASADMRFTAVSRDLADHWAGILDEVAVIPNGIDLSVFRSKRCSRRRLHAFWSGRIVPEKGLHLAIDAARAAGIPLRFAGPRLDPGYWREQIVPRLGSDLENLGHLTHAALADRLAEANVAIVSPRWDEPFGLVVAEALACGTPVAAFARGAIPQLVDRRCGALAEADDVLDLARAIRAALDCERRACRAQAEARFDSECMVDAYEALYVSQIARMRRPAARVPVVSAQGVLQHAPV